ncbi:MAG TPA: TolC family protein [Cyclobacteriaceae bacterium]|nr:TolC family protein [Cyclobacteriaceae bacterium]
MKRLLTAALLLIGAGANAQQLTLAECYEKARQNFPLIRQKELLVSTKEFTVANARSGYLPQLSINGQATYQSDVTKVPIEVPGFAIKTLPKDQYKLYAELNQSLYDGGAIKRQNAIAETNALVEDQRLEIELYKIKERINQIFFGTLLIDEQLAQVELIRKDINTSLQKVESSIRNGTAFKTNADILQAESLKTQQRAIELKAGKQAYMAMLGIFIGQELGESTTLQRPEDIQAAAEPNITRPEISLYNYQSQLFTAQQQLNNTKVLPRFGLFVQGGYGRPGLNMLNSDFATYYIGGLRLSWNLAGFYNTTRDKQQLNVNLQGINVQKEIFMFNTKLTLKQQHTDITKLNDLIAVDQQIIELRTKIKTTAKAQLDNGVMTANDYLRELNAEDQARQNLSVHKIQLLMTEYNYLATTGESK